MDNYRGLAGQMELEEDLRKSRVRRRIYICVAIVIAAGTALAGAGHAFGRSVSNRHPIFMRYATPGPARLRFTSARHPLL
jgi:hypothetical protein